MNLIWKALLVCMLCSTAAYAQKPRKTTLEPKKPKRETPSQPKNYKSELGFSGGILTAANAGGTGFGGRIQWLYKLAPHIQIGPAIEMAVGGVNRSSGYFAASMHANVPIMLGKHSYLYPGVEAMFITLPGYTASFTLTCGAHLGICVPLSGSIFFNIEGGLRSIPGDGLGYSGLAGFRFGL